MDAVKIRWLREATASLDSHFDYVSSRNPTAAKAVFQRIVGAVERLQEFPSSGRVGRIGGTREVVVPGLPYVVVYRIKKDIVEILRVFHTSTDWPSRADG